MLGALLAALLNWLLGWLLERLEAAHVHVSLWRGMRER
jgi:hypothetical protein